MNSPLQLDEINASVPSPSSPQANLSAYFSVRASTIFSPLGQGSATTTLGAPRRIQTRGGITRGTRNSRIPANKFLSHDMQESNSEISENEETYVQNKPKSSNHRVCEQLNSFS